MKQILFFILTLSLCANQLQAKNGENLLDDIVNNRFAPQHPIQIQSLPDGEHYTALSEDKKSIIKYSYKTGQQVEVLLDLPKTRGDVQVNNIDGYIISNTGFRIVFWNNVNPIYRRSWEADIYDYDVRRNYVKPLSDSPGKLMHPTLSPDGRMCAFVRENNIWLKKFDFDTESQVTQDGAINQILNGTSDWIYEEEFAVTNRMCWSPDSKYLAFVKTNESEVKEFKFQVFDGSLYPGWHQYKYPKAGEKNSLATVHTYSVDTRDIKQMDIPNNGSLYIPRITFTNNPEQLVIMCLNREQNVFSMYYANPKSKVCRMILTDNSKTYIDYQWLNSIHFTDTHFTYVSESDGFAHLYIYGLLGSGKRQLTSGSWDVTRFLGIDAATQAVYYESAEESPLRRAVYQIDAKGKKTKLSSKTGFNEATFSSNFSYFINSYSNATTPNVYTICDSKGKELVTLEDNKGLQEKLANTQFSPKEFITIPTPDGYELNAWIIKPNGFDESKQYPMLLVPYNGPNSQIVLDKYSFGWEHYLSQQGFAVVGVDGRGTGAKGESFRKCTYMKLGVLESDDQIHAARHLGQLPYINKDQIAIWGWSFGGTVSLMALSRSGGIIKAGIAIAPVTDWRFYDTIYTERYMRTPKENESGYNAASPFTYIPQLKGKLLLAHGTADDNVHYQNTLYYSQALVESGIQFDTQIYTNKNHSISDAKSLAHLAKTCLRFLQTNLQND